MELIIFHGQEINTSHNIVDLAGHTDLQAQLPTESTSLEIEHGLIWQFLLK